VYTQYMTIRAMRKLIEGAGLRVVKKRGFGFPPVRIFLPLEKGHRFGLDQVAQRILWICHPARGDG